MRLALITGFVLTGCASSTLDFPAAPVSPGDPPLEALPEAYRGNFGGWAKEVRCWPFVNCARAPAQSPAHAEVAGYTSARSPSGGVAAGKTLHVYLRILIVAGTDDKPAHAFEGLILTAKSGESGRLIKGINPSGHGGELLTEFALEMPAKIPSGTYTLRTTRFLDKRARRSCIGI